MAKKNPRGAPIRKTAEQILRESQEYFGEQKSVDPTELYDYRLHKRNDFEDSIRRVPGDTAVWINYAKWEGSQNEFDRGRSMWELALEEDCRNHTLWCKYAEFEMMNKFINHARNVWDRAVAVLPHVDQLWYKYIRMEEIAGNVAAARLIFDRWMHWTPDQQAWLSYIKFELRYEQVELARQVFERLVQCHPNVVSSWIKYAKFEMRRGEIDRARNVYERALEKKLADGDGDDDDDEGAEQLFVAFAEFEERYKESESEALRKEFGDWVLIEDAIVGKGKAPKDKAYIHFEKSQGERERRRALYERLLERTKHLKVWISYAKFEASALSKDGRNPDLSEADLRERKKQSIQRARRVFEKGINYYKTSAPEMMEERAMLLEEWLNMERSFGELGDVSLVQAMLPKKLKKRRQITSDIGLSAGYEEYIDYLFPEESQKTNFKILEAASKWIKQKIVSNDQ